MNYMAQVIWGGGILLAGVSSAEASEGVPAGSGAAYCRFVPERLDDFV